MKTNQSSVKKKEPVCPTCKRRRPEGWAAALRKKRSAAIKKALSEVEVKGRPRKIDYQKVYKAKDKGASLSEIAKLTGATIGSIQHALRIR